ncbi:protein STABILIZED1 [Artemisia annua]|uniref:Protein STABILIZED1 n=1 Tax=Artemisia annua TaxID=35608 RepID=A0A2U1KSG7_ARTAN|nr:protein STABILIZED1 [Artemisia annua]
MDNISTSLCMQGIIPKNEESEHQYPKEAQANSNVLSESSPNHHLKSQLVKVIHLIQGLVEHWAKFSTTAGLGVIHRGHLQQGRSLMAPYPPQSGSGHGVLYVKQVDLCRYLHFDYHRICKHVHFDRLSILYDQIEDFLTKNRPITAMLLVIAWFTSIAPLNKPPLPVARTFCFPSTLARTEGMCTIKIACIMKEYDTVLDSRMQDLTAVGEGQGTVMGHKLSMKISNDADISDIKKAILLLNSVIQTNLKHAPGSIAAARLEVAGKNQKARL